jgi:flagellar M-ring protein FliF
MLTARSSGSRQEGEDSTRETVSLTSGEEVEKETLGLTPKRVTVSVGIPSTYFEKVWHERNPSEEGSEPKKPDQAALDAIRQEESAKIQKHVAALLPPVEGLSDLTELVTVTTFQDIRAPKLPEPPVTEHALGWLAQYWPTLGMIGLALFSLVMLRSMVRSAPPATPTTSFPVLYAKESAEPEEEPAHTAAQKRLRRFQGSGVSLRDELSELVHEDPDVAANILKSWIGHAG